MNIHVKTWLTVILTLVAGTCLAAAPDLSLPDNPAVPEGLGVNIHFTDPRPGEMEMLAEAGFRWIRMDFAWGGTERQKGQYDFSAYDRLLAALEPHGIRALFILDYSNRFYDDGLSPCSDEGRAAFARWAAAAVQRFRGRGILWEMYNEPNISFWKPKPDAEQYVKLALAVGQAIRQVAPGELYIGPATSQVDLKFLEKCFQAGLLEYWSAVSVHPYRQQPPETAAADYARLRRMIAQYAPAGKRIPILSGEWGYSAAWQKMDAEKQGKMLPRQWLTNLSNDVPISIWYDWHDDGPDPKEPEHHFGTVLFPYREGQRPVYEPKPAYRAAQTLTKVLAGFRFNKRLHLGNEEDYVLLWTKEDDVRLTVWTVAKSPHAAVIPASPGRFTAIGHTGEPLPPLTADDRGSDRHPDGRPAVLDAVGAQRSAALGRRLAAGASGSRRRGRPAGGRDAPVSQPARRGHPRRTDQGRSSTSAAGQQHLVDVWAARAARCRVENCAVDLLRRSARRVLPDHAGVGFPSVACRRPAGDEPVPTRAIGQPDRTGVLRNLTVDGSVRLVGRANRTTGAFGGGANGTRRAVPGQGRDPLAVASGSPRRRPGRPGAVGPASRDASASSTTLRAGPPNRSAPPTRFFPTATPRWPRPRPPNWASRRRARPCPARRRSGIRYQFDAGWKFVRLAPRDNAVTKIEGQPQAFRAWVYGDGSGNQLRLRLADATGQTFQPGGQPLDWRGWRSVTIPLEAGNSGHWGGADDGVIHYPIRWDTLLLIDSARREKTAGDIYLASPVLVYGD